MPRFLNFEDLLSSLLYKSGDLILNSHKNSSAVGSSSIVFTLFVIALFATVVWVLFLGQKKDSWKLDHDIRIKAVICIKLLVYK